MVKALTIVSMWLFLPESTAVVKFNTNIIDAKDRSNIDLSRFEVDDYTPQGDYLLDILINGRLLPERYLVTYLAIDDGKATKLCLTPELVNLFGLSTEIRESMTLWNNGKCVAIDERKEITTQYDKEKQYLIISIPQAWLAYNDPYWVPPSQWGNGVAGILLDYNLFGYRYSPNIGGSTTNFSSYGTTGANMGPWRIRADYQYINTETAGEHYHNFNWPQVYAFRAIPSIGAKFIGGQTYLNSSIFDSFRFLGVSLSSDERMLPPTLRGYAPQVMGIARTNARVVLSQNGRVLYQTNVAPGPFVIQDISEAVQGNIEVRVEEEDGRVTVFQVNAASVPFLTRKGAVRYKTALGRPMPGGNNSASNPAFFSGEFSWGAFNNVSLYGGLMTTSQDYTSAALGVGQNLYDFGALSIDITHSRAQLPNEEKQSGESYRVNYSKRFEQTDSQISFAGYRFSKKNFMSMSQYLDRLNGNIALQYDKQAYTVTANQYLAWPDITIYLSMARRTYWNAAPSNNYGISMSKIFDIGTFKGISATISANKMNNPYGSENQMFLSLSVPISMGQQASYDAQQGSNTDYTQNISYFNNQDSKNIWRISAGGGNPELQKGNGVFRGGYQYSSPYGEFGLDGSHKNNEYNSINANWYGSITATAYGVAAHQNKAGNEPRIMVDTGDVSGVSLNNNSAVTNRFGVAVVSGATSYQQSDIRVDVQNLPDDIEVYNTVIQKTLTEGAIGYREIRAVKGQQMMVIIRLKDGSFPPLGASVITDKTGAEVGIVGDDGLTYLAGLQDAERLTVQWGKKQCTFILPKDKGMNSGKVLLPCQ
ncbi:outer membrane fimbrial usher porin [Yersinia similis]|nr:outer membrane fimbrial usher porin [Yersinia similis]